MTHGPLLDLFASSFSGRAGEPALDVGPAGGPVRTLSFGEIDARASGMARALANRGLRKGDRLAAQLPNGLPFLDLFLACLKLGAILVPVNVLYRERELGHILGDAEPRALVTSPEGASLAPPGTVVWDAEELLASSSRGAAVEPGDEGSAGGRDGGSLGRRPGTALGMTAGSVGVKAGSVGVKAGSVGVTGETPAAIVYTSGTTGRAKGAVLTHGNLAANARALVGAWRITAADRYLAVLPLFHVHGLGNGVCSWLASGCRMRLVPRFEHEKAAALFEEYRPTLFFGVPTVYVRLLELPEEAARPIGRTLRLFVSGSAPLPATVFERFRARFGHAILERYGMTETLMTVSNPYEGERRPGTVGRPLPGVDVRIVGEDGRDRPAGEVGELWVRGPAVSPGYWRRPDATAAAFVDGWFRTGDLGERSSDGYLTLRGRASDMVISAGFNVYPREIEDLLLEQPGVREAAVVGVPDAVRGEVPVAFYAGDAEPADLEAVCRASLASFKVPRRFTRVEALPRNAMGKLDKARLRERA